MKMRILVRSSINNEMKNQFILILLLINLTGCAVFRPANRSADNLSAGPVDQESGKKQQPTFIQGISTQPVQTQSVSATGPSNSPESTLYNSSTSKTVVPASGKEDYNPLQFKFAILTNSPVEELTNLRLLVFMNQWYGVPYHYGGSSKDGIDCSAFAALLLSRVYDVNQLPRISAEQYHVSRRISKKDLREGDLVFFHTTGKGHRVTHVGVYLYNNRFVHASIAGVQISNLEEGYYMHHYVGAGRVIDSDRTY
jgi:cell wall-associated NlpC family hydrolase